MEQCKKRIIVYLISFFIYVAIFCILFSFAPMYWAKIVAGEETIVLHRSLLQVIRSPQLINSSYVFNVDLSLWILLGSCLSLISFCFIAFKVKYAKIFLMISSIIFFAVALSASMYVNGLHEEVGIFSIGYSYGIWLFVAEYICAMMYSKFFCIKRLKGD